MKTQVSSRFKALKPYVPGEQPADKVYIKLNTNESPFPPAPGIQKLLENYQTEDLRLYPDPTSSELRKAIANKYRVEPEQVFPGNGSDEVLSFIFYAFFDGERGSLLFPEHTYSFYPVYCAFYGIPCKKIPLADDYSVDLSMYPDNSASCGTIFPNPNAPTGIALGIGEIEKFLSRYPEQNLVAVDEAYADFGAKSCVPLHKKYPNLLTVHTFSKSRSLAGMRVGFAIGNKELIDTIITVKDSFNSYPLNRISQEAARIAIEDDDYFQKCRNEIMAIRENSISSLEKIGWQVLPSSANFIFARKDGYTGLDIYETLKASGILVRHFRIPGISEFVRITIGSEKEMEYLIGLMHALFR